MFNTINTINDTYTTTTTATETDKYKINTAYIGDIFSKEGCVCSNGFITTSTSSGITIKNSDITLSPVDPPLSFSKIKQHVPGKVYEFTFSDGETVKTICDEEDEFDLEFAFYLALAKKLYKYQYTSIGMIDKAYQLSYTNKYIKLVKKGIKLFFKGIEEDRLKQQQEKEKKERHKKYIEKKKKRAERKGEKERTQLYETIKWAIEDAKKEN